MTRWRMNSADIVYVGDNVEKDFQASQQLGMRSVWFMNEDGVYQTQIDRACIKDIGKLRGLI